MSFPKRLLAVGVAGFLLFPFAAQAQNGGFGLDLSADEPKKPEEKPEQAKPEDKPGDLPPPPLDTETRTPVAAEKPEGQGDVEKDITSEDRVKSVQRKAFLKQGRFELAPMMFVTVNDAFFPKYGPGLRGAYHLHDSLAVGARFFQYNLIPDDNVRLAKRQLQSRLPFVLPKYSFDLDLMWSPIYGKVSVFNSIRTFDLYVVGGAGGVASQTSDLGDGMHLSTHIGAGQRFALFDFLAIDVSAVELLYSDRPNAGTKSVLQHVLTVNAGLCLYLPPSFDYHNP